MSEIFDFRRYDPYSRVLTREEYDQAGMRAVRRRAVEAARKATRFGIILGTLGRQGNPAILAHLEQLFASRRLRYSVVLLSEISPAKLNAMGDVEAWVQIACPRLSIDWGEGFRIPVRLSLRLLLHVFPSCSSLTLSSLADAKALPFPWHVPSAATRQVPLASCRLRSPPTAASARRRC